MHDKEMVASRESFCVCSTQVLHTQKVLFLFFDMHVILCMWTYIKVKKQKVLVHFLVMWTVGPINKFVWLLQFQGSSNWWVLHNDKALFSFLLVQSCELKAICGLEYIHFPVLVCGYSSFRVYWRHCSPSLLRIHVKWKTHYLSVV